MTTTALIPYVSGDAVERMNAWARLDDDEIRRQTITACQAHDAAALWQLTEAYLLAHGRRGATASRYTLRNYRQGVMSLLDVWQQEKLLKPHRKAAVRWLRHLETAGEKSSTVQIRLAAARTLYKALRDAGATQADPFKDARVASDNTRPEDKRGPYADEEVKRLTAVATGDDLALVLLGAHAGLRVAEALALHWDDITIVNSTLTIRAGKGGKRRAVTMSPTLAHALRDLATTGERTVGVRSVYVLPYSTAVSARRRMRLLCQRASVAYKGIHALRHSAGTRIYSETGRLEDAQRHLGHTNLATTQVYAAWSDTRLKTALQGW